MAAVPSEAYVTKRRTVGSIGAGLFFVLLLLPSGLLAGAFTLADAIAVMTLATLCFVGLNGLGAAYWGVTNDTADGLVGTLQQLNIAAGGAGLVAGSAAMFAFGLEGSKAAYLLMVVFHLCLFVLMFSSSLLERL